MTTEVVHVREAAGQTVWFDLDLPDLRYLARELRLPAVDKLQRADDVEEALAILLEHFGVRSGVSGGDRHNAYRSCSGAALQPPAYSGLNFQCSLF